MKEGCKDVQQCVRKKNNKNRKKNYQLSNKGYCSRGRRKKGRKEKDKRRKEDRKDRYTLKRQEIKVKVNTATKIIACMEEERKEGRKEQEDNGRKEGNKEEK